MQLSFISVGQEKKASINTTQILLKRAIENWKNDRFEESLKESNLALLQAKELKDEYLIAKS